ncbi:MAG: pyridoxamine 5'-phosphate oxidase family protein [Acidimicrobiales bacterium]
MTEDEIWSFVRNGHTGIFTTLRRDGVPIAMPMWYCCLGRDVYMQTRGRKLQRIRNEPRCSFLVETGDRWAELVAVHLTGRAEHVAPDGDLQAAFAAEMDRKYRAYRGDGRDPEMPAQAAEYYAAQMQGLVRFVADGRILNWDNSKMMS